MIKSTVTVTVTVDNDTMDLIAFFSEMRRISQNGKPREALIRATNGKIQIYDVRPRGRSERKNGAR
jgi:hypothetical protein